jgi:ribosomal protein S11
MARADGGLIMSRAPHIGKKAAARTLTSAGTRIVRVAQVAAR